jgi:thermitase
MRVFLAPAVSALVLVISVGSAGVADAAPRFVEGEVLVEPRAGLPEAALARIASQARGQVGQLVRGTRVRVIKVPAGQESVVAQRLARNPHVRRAEPNWLHPPLAVPNDPLYANGWHLPKIGAPTAWSTSLGTDTVVAVLDTGVFAAHPDLSGRVLAGWNTASQNTDITDTFGHGTKVAGTVAASTNNSVGVSAVGWGARILPVKITNATDGYASTSNIAAGISWAAGRGAKVVNVSYDIVGSSIVESAAQQFRSTGGLVIGSAGNTGTDRGFGAQTGIVFVSGTDSADAKASWSSFGGHVDIAAPGVNIASTNTAGAYGSYSGTSYSAPIVAGVVALMRSANPALPPSQVESILFQTALDRGAAGFDGVFGWGRVNAAAAVAAAASASTADATAPSVSFASPGAGSTLTGLVPVSVNATDNIGVVKVELRVNGALVGTETAAPWAFSLDSAAFPAGAATLSATASDLAGNTRSTSVNVTIANADATGDAAGDTTGPTVSFTSPTANSTVSGTVAVSASANDPSGVSMLTVSVDGTLLCSGAPSVSCSWNTRRATAGAHTLSAVATDVKGNRSSTSITVNLGASSGTTGKKR